MTVVINGTTGIDTGTGSLIAADSTTPTYLDLFEDTDNGSNYVRLIAPTSVASNRTITLPDGTGTVAVNNVSGVLVSGTAQASTSGTSIDFTSIPSWVKRITVMFDSVSLSGTDNILVQIGPSGAVETTGYVSASAYAISGGASGGASSTAGFVIIVASSGNTHVGTMQLVNITGNTWVSSCSGSFTVGTASGVSGGGVKTLSSGPLARLSVTRTGTNTFDAGTINILYE